MLRLAALSVLPFIGGVLSQAASQYVDPDNGIVFMGSTDRVHGVTYGYAFPPVDGTNTDEFIGEIIAPIGVAWAGMVPGGSMLRNLLLVAWPDGDEIVATPRIAT